MRNISTDGVTQRKNLARFNGPSIDRKQCDSMILSITENNRSLDDQILKKEKEIQDMKDVIAMKRSEIADLRKAWEDGLDEWERWMRAKDQIYTRRK